MVISRCLQIGRAVYSLKVMLIVRLKTEVISRIVGVERRLVSREERTRTSPLPAVRYVLALTPPPVGSLSAYQSIFNLKFLNTKRMRGCVRVYISGTYHQVATPYSSPLALIPHTPSSFLYFSVQSRSPHTTTPTMNPSMKVII